MFNFLNFLKTIVIDNFKIFYSNFKIIINDFRKIFLFFLLLPLIYWIIKIQLNICIIFSIYYFFVFILHYFLKIPYTINCKELPLNFYYIIRHTLPTLFIYFPRAKGFILFYNSLRFVVNNIFNKSIFNKSLKLNLYDFFLFSIFFSIFFFIKISIFMLLGYSYLSISVTADFVVNFFDMLGFNYESKKAKYQHIILNCVLNFDDTIGKADEMAIHLFPDGSIILNMKNTVEGFFGKCVRSDLIRKACFSNKKTKLKKFFINNHFSYVMKSKYYTNKCVGTNKTSSEFLKIYNKLEQEKMKLTCKYDLNLKGDDKPDYLTPPYELNLENNIIEELPINMEEKTNRFGQNAYAYLLYEKDTKLLYLDNKSFIKDDTFPTLQEFAEDAKLDIYEDINNINTFEKLNQEFLNSPKGKVEYEIFKHYIKGIKYFDLNSNIEDE